MIPFVESAQVSVPLQLAANLLYATKKIPPHDDKTLYDVRLQADVREAIRTASSDGAFDWVIEEIRRRLIRKPYCAYVTGLQFDEHNILLVSITGAFGTVVEPYNQPWTRLVRYIQPSTDRSVSGWGVLNEELHTDGTDWPQPNDLTCLLCVRADQNGGGRSRLLDIDTILDDLDTGFGREAIDILHQEAVPWYIANELGGGVFRRPVYAENSIRWCRYTINIALENKQEFLSESISTSLSALEQVLKEAKGIIDFAMAPGGLLFVNNKRCLHARTTIKNPQYSRRLVLRTKIVCPEGMIT